MTIYLSCIVRYPCFIKSNRILGSVTAFVNEGQASQKKIENCEHLKCRLRGAVVKINEKSSSSCQMLSIVLKQRGHEGTPKIEGTTRARGHEGTPTWKARGHAENLGTRARQHWWHEGTPKIWARGHDNIEGMRARRNFGHEGTRRLKGTQGTPGTRFNRLVFDTVLHCQKFWNLL